LPLKVLKCNIDGVAGDAPNVRWICADESVFGRHGFFDFYQPGELSGLHLRPFRISGTTAPLGEIGKALPSAAVSSGDDSKEPIAL
jgi:hypothetical protein